MKIAKTIAARNPARTSLSGWKVINPANRWTATVKAHVAQYRGCCIAWLGIFVLFVSNPLDTLIPLNYSHATSTAITEALILVSPVGVFVSLAISVKVIDDCAANNSLRNSVSGSRNHSWKFFFMTEKVRWV